MNDRQKVSDFYSSRSGDLDPCLTFMFNVNSKAIERINQVNEQKCSQKQLQSIR